ncbi:MAG: iron complex outermembrane receptor protein [Arcticibacterium sp.]|jgi:iron complex outermembrane receptor protein
MWRLSKIFLFFALLPSSLYAQQCSIKLHGQVIDEVTGVPLPFATVYLEELELVQQADMEGYFHFDDLCPGSTHIKLSHVSCEPLREFINIERDSVLYLYMHHHEELMDEVLVHGNKNDSRTQNSNTLDKDLISKESNKNLGELLESIAGISALKTGSGIAKPVIHGLYGNRITILNNGIAQAGQQWGNDHAPEIDPFSADHISVIKGVGALEFSGSTLGGVVLIEPKELDDEPHLHGMVNYIYQSNGNGSTFNTEFGKSEGDISWRLNGTLKGIGDQKTPEYFLTNTGRREANASLELQKKSQKLTHSIYLSTYNSEIGILRGSHIGNLSDLTLAFNQEEPFFTENSFSFNIAEPRQEVSHHLLKLKSTFLNNKASQWVFQYAAQLNDRKEFDVRRAGRSDQAALSLLQFAHFLEANYSHSYKDGGFFKTGLQGEIKDNTNNPLTGILPLIPDYLSYKASGFGFYQQQKNELFYEFGGRLDIKQLNVAAISRDLPRRVERFNNTFYNGSLSAGLRYEVSNEFKLNLNAGYVWRAPEVNELHSFGLHQGVSSLEIGNRKLVSETSLKITASADLSLNEQLFFQALAYFQCIEDYIYLKPETAYVLTIRGAFPTFSYDQTNARIIGADFLLSYEPFTKLRLISKAAILRGTDISNAIPLVFMPSNNISNAVNLSFNDGKRLKTNALSIEHKTVFRQNNLKAEQDFLATPNTYHLLNFGFNSSLVMKSKSIGFGVKIENATNVKFRDYLNRQRYFSDELGRNILLRINYKF